MSHLCIPKKYFAKSVYTPTNFPFMYFQKIFGKVSVHCKEFTIYVFPNNILPSQCTLQTVSHLCIHKKDFAKSVYTTNNFPIMYSQKIFCQVSVHCKQFPIYILPKNILPRLCTLQTISHLCIPKKDLTKSVYTANNFPFMFSQK